MQLLVKLKKETLSPSVVRRSGRVCETRQYKISEPTRRVHKVIAGTLQTFDNSFSEPICRVSQTLPAECHKGIHSVDLDLQIAVGATLSLIFRKT